MKNTIVVTLVVGCMFIIISGFSIYDYANNHEFSTAVQAFNRFAIGATFIVISQGFRILRDHCYGKPEQKHFHVYHYKGKEDM